MAEGRWLDDAYSGAPREGNAGPRLLSWMKWTWPLMLVAAVACTAWLGPAGGLVGLAAWLGSCAIPNHYDGKAKKRPATRP